MSEMNPQSAELNQNPTRYRNKIQHSPHSLPATSCSPLPFRSPVSGFSFFFTPPPANPVLLSKIHPKFKIHHSKFSYPSIHPVAVFATTLGSGFVEMILHPPIQNQPHWLPATNSKSIIQNSKSGDSSPISSFK